MPMLKPRADRVLKKTGVEFRDEEFKEAYPNLYSYLFDKSYDDGQSRMTATLSMFTDDNCLKLVINDRDNKRSAFIEAPTLMGLFAELEAGLRDDSLEWKVKINMAGGEPKTPF